MKSSVPGGLTRTMTRVGSSSDSMSAPRAAVFAAGATASSRSRMTASARSSALRVSLRAVGGAEQQRGTEVEAAHDVLLRRRRRRRHPRHHMSATRVAVATTSPSWLRPVWRIVTIPCPGREADRRFSTISVSV